MINYIWHVLTALLILTTIVGLFYIVKLAQLSKAWKSVWMLVIGHVILSPISRIIYRLLYNPCPENVGEFILLFTSPIIGTLLFVLALRKLLKFFEQSIDELKNGGK